MTASERAGSGGVNRQLEIHIGSQQEHDAQLPLRDRDDSCADLAGFAASVAYCPVDVDLSIVIWYWEEAVAFRRLGATSSLAGIPGIHHCQSLMSRGGLDVTPIVSTELSSRSARSTGVSVDP
eukprot:CAMPEP_0195009122 /NCGR_PEP_ID=MMETSP0326_2-20130528/9033_1 /TAXON_ID=2866 ORGANISM="Crypthecodinium cohnii, Strain Seligo" /NCGR_SAMPLE_ID=MMETSP0326_2 /ASSEMBLY_ACC=CAM_ASM_000348 /LENGTH=122 /DNA_ID=CAMNT_0040017209 /DNA_START=251 /DNA_END=617 /DNA_ORIENTATION=-